MSSPTLDVFAHIASVIKDSAHLHRAADDNVVDDKVFHRDLIIRVLSLF